MEQSIICLILTLKVKYLKDKEASFMILRCRKTFLWIVDHIKCVCSYSEIGGSSAAPGTSQSTNNSTSNSDGQGQSSLISNIAHVCKN